ncbi:MAG: M23 family metallopeptidase [Clostridiales bacterium]|nr:M23 family metallopeptidase [Clostridiales bacterium]
MSKIFSFIKRNSFYFIIGLCALIIGLSITLVSIFGFETEKPLTGEISGVDKPVDTPDTPVDTPIDTPNQNVSTKIEFIYPVNGYVLKDYSDTVVFNSTLNRYSKHTAIDFYAEDGAPVYAVYDGVIESVDYNLLTGVTITVDHGNGLKTVYNSLLNEDLITVGTEVLQGDTIGFVSNTNLQESKDGAHLHFEVIENSQVINPEKYLVLDEK